MEKDWFWLCSIKGIYQKEKERLLRHFGSLEALVNASEEEIWRLPVIKEEAKEKIIAHKRNFSVEEAYDKCERQGIRFLSREHTEYPEKLKRTEDAPFGIFIKGELPQEQHLAAVVGARMCSAYGKNCAERLGEAFGIHGIGLVSGLACGIDAAAQAACLEAGGHSYGVLGSGVDICYPKEHFWLYQKLAEGGGGVISEYPPGMGVLPFHFPMRNRIISGLVDVVIVVEARKKSGSLITADLALEQGREVYAIPGRIDDALSVGCNRLIAQGAGVITQIDDFLSELGMDPAKKEKKKNSNIVLATSENMVYSCLDSEVCSLNEILGRANLPAGEAVSALISLQMKGLVKETAGRYQRCKEK